MRPGLSVVVSDRIDDVDVAMSLVHDGYVESGYIEPQPSGRRLIPHYLTPGAVFALGYFEDAPAGVCAGIPDGPWGLPSEHAFPDEFREVRQRGPLLEVCSLVVARNRRGMTREILMGTVGALLRAAAAGGDDPTIVVTMAPEQERFYAALFGVRPAGPSRDLYGAPATLHERPLTEMLEHILSGGSIMRRAMAEVLTRPTHEWLVSHLRDRAPDPVGPMGAAVSPPDLGAWPRHRDPGPPWAAAGAGTAPAPG